jgi:hypothetical protein
MRTYDGPEHESLRATIRSIFLHCSGFTANAYIEGALRSMGVSHISELSPWGANFTRKFIEKILPCDVEG